MGKIRDLLRNLSIKKSFIFYVSTFIFIAVTFSLLSMKLSKDIRASVNTNYSESVIYFKGLNGEIINDTYYNYSKNDSVIIEICDFLESWAIIIYFSFCIVMAAMLFYITKLKKPFEILNNAVEKITKNDLDFKISYNNKDEMGDLCKSMEKMRTFMEIYNKKIWSDMEERKRLNAVFSHDLKNPLTVLKGYTDFLLKYLEKDLISQKKLISSILTMSNHILRLEKYVEDMNTLQKLEDVIVECKLIVLKNLLVCLKETADFLASDSNIKINFSDNIIDKNLTIKLDVFIINQVFENIISNALCYAKSKIVINFKDEYGMFKIIILDDGPGFSGEDLKKATNPFFKGKNSIGNTHFGLGLNICKILSEKHNGKIILENVSNGGSKVTVSFKKCEF
ncbi:MAG: HAMP domain-containing sensor histidine kinase [Clostridiales bacterium]